MQAVWCVIQLARVESRNDSTYSAARKPFAVDGRTRHMDIAEEPVPVIEEEERDLPRSPQRGASCMYAASSSL